MLDTNKICNIAHLYLLKHQNTEYIEPIQTFGDDVELETKINIEKASDVEMALEELAKIGITKTEKRCEWHHFFTKTEDCEAHDALILSNKSSEVWIKRKKDKKVINTDSGLPILFRHESRLNPRNLTYRENFKEIISQRYVGSFDKICIDFYFLIKGFSFAMTLSLATEVLTKSQLYQIEIEYDGHLNTVSPPSMQDVLIAFEKTFDDIFLPFKQRVTAHTKIEWLNELKKTA